MARASSLTLADGERARAVRAVAVEPAPQSIVTSSSRRDLDVARLGCGSAPCAPEATIGGKLTRLAPAAAHRTSRSSATVAPRSAREAAAQDLE